jgi:hypothetical protein
MRTHGVPDRGAKQVARSSISEGRFGRMFRRLPAAPQLDDATLQALAESMREPEASGGGGWGGPATPPTDLDNPSIPAGYTYLGQFIGHDLTFDPVSSLQRQNDPDALTDFRSPRFDLDSLYGSGPADEPFQYDTAQPGKLLIEPNRSGVEDLPRNSQDIALIGDPRNDENLLVSQLQLVFLKLHNKIHDLVAADPNVPVDGRFEEAQKLVRWHYQWVIIRDFLPRIVGQRTLDTVLSFEDDGSPRIRRRFYLPKTKPYMPVELSVAAYRYGHSQVRPRYDLNGNVTNRPVFAPGDAVGEVDDLRGFRRLPAGWTIDWALFFAIDGATPQLSRKLDAKLTTALFDLPGRAADQPQSLAFLNLKRGQALGLPSGQDVARLMRVARVFSGADFGAPEPTPLWFYILKESELTLADDADPTSGGRHLGHVGGRIIAEVLLGLLELDSRSFVNTEPTWQPTLPTATGAPETFQMADLVKFATT